MKFCTLLFAVTALSTSICDADVRVVTGGETVIDLDQDFLDSAGLTVSSTEDATFTGNTLFFDIKSRDVLQPTTFKYEIPGLTPVSGSIKHPGSVFFNSDTSEVEISDLSIQFVGGFFVSGTITTVLGPTSLPLFDLANSPVGGNTSLTITGDILVTPNLATFLGAGVSAGDTAGSINTNATAAIPEPASLGFIAICGMTSLLRRRRRV